MSIEIPVVLMLSLGESEEFFHQFCDTNLYEENCRINLRLKRT